MSHFTCQIYISKFIQYIYIYINVKLKYYFLHLDNYSCVSRTCFLASSLGFELTDQANMESTISHSDTHLSPFSLGFLLLLNSANAQCPPNALWIWRMLPSWQWWQLSITLGAYCSWSTSLNHMNEEESLLPSRLLGLCWIWRS